MTKIKEAALESELTKIDVTEELAACPIDFSKSQVANPRAGQKQKEYNNGLSKSNFNERKNMRQTKNHNLINYLQTEHCQLNPENIA